jgi:DNA uptake protein ComE-like DNA-binding protein
MRCVLHPHRSQDGAAANRVRRGFATLLVFALIVFGTVVVSVMQATALSQASAGREAMARVRAYWAARAGIESVIARLEYLTENSNGESVISQLDEIAEVCEGEMSGATWRVATTDDRGEIAGVADAASKLNINRLTREQLLLLQPYMSEDVADAILDWIDEDDDPNPLGAEAAYYQTQANPALPRNAPMRSITELELVAGMDPRDVRGEDWNLNGLLDPEENDGDESWPPDNADGVLDAGYSGILTTASVESDVAGSGQPRLDLTVAQPGDLVERLGVSSEQAQAIADYVGATPGATLADFITTDLNTLARRVRGQQGGRGRQQPPPVPSLTREQLGALLDECSVGPVPVGGPGKLNINTCAPQTLEYLPQILPETADAIIAERSARPEGFTSLADLLSVPGIGRRQLAAVYEHLCVRSNVFLATVRGRDTKSGIEVEIRVTLNRSRLPVVIEEVVVR